jgi:hypothetical protein
MSIAETGRRTNNGTPDHIAIVNASAKKILALIKNAKALMIIDTINSFTNAMTEINSMSGIGVQASL